MGEGVIADLVAFGDIALHQVGIGFRIAADDEERRVHVLGFRMSRICGVHSGSGPSSKVSAISLPAAPNWRIT